jgi:hypothetical protein
MWMASIGSSAGIFSPSIPDAVAYLTVDGQMHIFTIPVEQ